ncbi:MAG: GNAT family N-acetyltransferase [Hyphomonadaceae bacterium]|nr:GNAT family N-acetyltransferase [Hyphomonadaceae bacterium]
MTYRVLQLDRMPPGFEALCDAAESEGYGFLTRLSARWRERRYDDDPLATLRTALDGDALIAIGAQTYDEYDPSPLHRRIRHFYVAPHKRRGGVGRALATALIADAFARAPRLHLRATHALSTAFWDAMGFVRVDRQDRSHQLIRP